jgi:uncharacterized protein (UPF0264 family)
MFFLKTVLIVPQRASKCGNQIVIINREMGDGESRFDVFSSEILNKCVSGSFDNDSES